jgi:Lecithin retinol acyltransferase
MRAKHYSVVQVPSLINAAPLGHAVDAGYGLPMGAHVITWRRGYLHHGIYVGGGNVVHYSGWTRGLHRGPVEEIPLDRFMCGGGVWARCRNPYHFDPCEVIRRARSRVGEDHYRVFSNNCEHFCEWCLHGAPRSYQVEALLSVPARILESALRLIARLVPSSSNGARDPFKRGDFARAGKLSGWVVATDPFVLRWQAVLNNSNVSRSGAAVAQSGRGCGLCRRQSIPLFNCVAGNNLL